MGPEFAEYCYYSQSSLKFVVLRLLICESVEHSFRNDNVGSKFDGSSTFYG